VFIKSYSTYTSTSYVHRPRRKLRQRPRKPLKEAMYPHLLRKNRRKMKKLRRVMGRKAHLRKRRRRRKGRKRKNLHLPQQQPRRKGVSVL